MNLLQLKNAQLSFGHPPLLDHIELVVHAQERICLVGRNGCGKSTLLKVIGGEQPLDDGLRIVAGEVRISRLPQDPPQDIDATLFDYVAEGMADVGSLLKQYFHQIQEVTHNPSEVNLSRLEALQQELEHNNAWQFEQQIEQVLTQLGLEGTQHLSELSGGWRRKAALARALAGNPDILLLDEPTNHLDIGMIRWLEKMLLDYKGAIVFVSHDRAFIRNLATRIVDLDRGHLVSYPGNYQAYLEQKEKDLIDESNANAQFDKKLSQEEAWIRQGIKARRTRNEGRVRALRALRQEYAQRRQRQGSATIRLNQGDSSGKLVFESTGLGFAYDGKPIVNGLELTVLRGDKLALIGPNGCGKSTLIKLLLGEINPDAGEVRTGTNLEIAYFDQHRLQLDPSKTVVDTVADGKREVDINGRSRHVISYLQDYLFTPDRINGPVSALSGGEKNRLLLAKLLLKPSNLLILDEPTNDLDVETLELLEDILTQYQGTLILVSHDREFVDNVVTRSLFFDGSGKITEFVGGYADIEQWIAESRKSEVVGETSEKTDSPKAKSSTGKNKKLSYKHKLELEELPAKIEALEEKVEQLQREISDPSFFKQESALSNQTLADLADAEKSLSLAYDRWDELEGMLE